MRLRTVYKVHQYLMLALLLALPCRSVAQRSADPTTPTSSSGPEYCIPPFMGATYAGILLVQLDGTPALNRASLWNERYINTNASTTVETGKTYTVRVTTDNTLSSIFGNTNTRVWIDWNHDYDFDDPGEQVGTWNDHPLNQPQIKTFSVPATAAIGTTRMRVYTDMVESGGHDSPIPCGYEYSFAGIEHHGEVEDYELTIVGDSNPNSPPTIQSRPDTAAVEGKPYTFVLKLRDADPQDKVSFEFIARPSWLTSSTDEYSGTFTLTLSGTPKRANVGDTVVVVRYSDTKGSGETLTFTIHVQKVNSAPAAAALLLPKNDAVVNLATATSPMTFRWTRAIDPDPEDQLTYELRLQGPTLDTLVAGLSDTTISIDLVGRLAPNQTYTWSVRANDGAASSPATPSFSFSTVDGTSDAGDAPIPSGTLTLESNYPNPTSGRTVVPYVLPETTVATITLHSIDGRLARTLVPASRQSVGRHTATFDLSGLPAGVYVVRLTTSTGTVARTIDLTR